MPFAGYKDFSDCVSKNASKDDPEAYCAAIQKKAKDEAMTKAHTCPDCDRSGFLTEQALQDHAEAVHTFGERSELVRKAIRAQHRWAYLVNIAEDWVVFEVDGDDGWRLLKQGYTFDDTSGTVTLGGEPVEVYAKISYPTLPQTDEAAELRDEGRALLEVLKSH